MQRWSSKSVPCFITCALIGQVTAQHRLIMIRVEHEISKGL